MEYGNDINIDGKLIASENLQQEATKVVAATDSTNQPDVIVDWSKTNKFIYDLTDTDLSGGSATGKLIFINGQVNNITNQLIVMQPTGFGENRVVLSIEAFNTEELNVPISINHLSDITDVINAAGTTSVQLYYTGSSYEINTSIASTEVSVSSTTTKFDIYDGATGITVNGEIITLTHSLNITDIVWQLFMSNEAVLPHAFEVIDANTINLTFKPSLPIQSDAVVLHLTKLS